MKKAIEEFREQTRELGLRPGARRQRQNGFRAGRWHGRLFENFRNDFLDAVPHEIVQRGGTKSLLRRSQFGFNISGPVYLPGIYYGGRNTYFSLSYEGVRERISRSFLRTIPTVPERAGDYSQVVDPAGSLLPIYDPLGTQRNPDFDPSQPVTRDNLEYVRAQFPNNEIPAHRLDPVATKAVELYPHPNASAGPFFRNNYFVVSPETNTANGMILKVDHSLVERHRLSLGASFSNGFLGAARWFPTPANPGPPDRRFSSRRGSLEHVFTVSPQTVNTFGFEAETDSSRSGVGADADYASQIGLDGVGKEGFPYFLVSPYLPMGRSFPVSRNARNNFSWTNAFSTRRGKHSFRIVGRHTRYQVHSFWPQHPAGSFRFSSGITSLPGIVNTGHAFAGFLLGMPELAEISLVASPSYFRRSSSRIFFRHTYEASRGLNFNFGLDLRHDTPRVEKFDRQSTVDLTAVNPANGRPGALVVAGVGGQGSAFQPAQTKPEPSISIAWSPRGDSRTVVRARFEREYGMIPLYSGQWGTQAFNIAPTFISPNPQLDPALLVMDGVPPPDNPPPDLRPEAANDTNADLIDMTGRQPTYQSASLSLERELPAAVVATIGASYSGGKNLLVGNYVARPNAIPIDALRFRDRLNDEQFNRSLRPYPQYKGFDVGSIYPLGRYRRTEGFLRLEKRATRGLTLNLYYEFSKQMDDYSGPGGRQDYYNRDAEWSLAAGRHPHRLSLSYTYELPLGSGKPFFPYSDWRRHMVGGWSLSGVSSLVSGEPIALRPQFNNTGGVVDALRVNVVPGVDPHVDNPGPELWFNPEAFDQPADFTIGDGPRTHPALRGPISQNYDLSVNKRFALATDRTVELSAVALNFLNHANWNDPDTVIGPSFAPNVNAGRIIGSRGGRVIQLGLRFSF